MKCSGVRDKLMEYASRELPSAEAERITAHLADCAGCRKQFDVAREALDALSLLRADEPAPDLIAGVRRKLAQEEMGRHPLLRPWTVVGYASLACAIIAACWILLKPAPQPGMPVVREPERIQTMPRTPAPTVKPVVVDHKPIPKPRPLVATADRPRAKPVHRRPSPRYLVRRPRPAPAEPVIKLTVSPRQPEAFLVSASEDQPDAPKVRVVRHFDVGGNIRSVTITDHAEPAVVPSPRLILPGTNDTPDDPKPVREESGVNYGGRLDNA